MEVIAETLYIVALRDAPSSLPADAKIAAEARYARELERALGGQEQVAATLDSVLSLQGLRKAGHEARVPVVVAVVAVAAPSAFFDAGLGLCVACSF